MRIRLGAALVSLLLLPSLSFADTVYLANGRAFEGVIAEVTDSEVKIRMPGGSLSLPRSHVLRVESSDSDFAEYLRRKEKLRRGGAGAADWLALARWAKEQGVSHGAREAALIAAETDPRLEGLAPFMRSYAYVLDEQLDRWVPYSDYMRRRGFVHSNGQWITRDEYATRVRAEEEERARWRAEQAERLAASRTRAVQDAQLTLVQMEIQERLDRYAHPVVYGVPLYYVPTFIAVPPCCSRGPEPHGPSNPPGGLPGAKPRPHRGTVDRIPGSLIPGNYDLTSRP